MFGSFAVAQLIVYVDGDGWGEREMEMLIRVGGYTPYFLPHLLICLLLVNNSSSEASSEHILIPY